MGSLEEASRRQWWTEEEEEALKKLVEHQVPVHEMSAVLADRNVTSIRNKIYHMGLTVTPRSRSVNHDLLNMLCQNVEEI